MSVKLLAPRNDPEKHYIFMMDKEPNLCGKNKTQKEAQTLLNEWEKRVEIKT